MIVTFLIFGLDPIESLNLLVKGSLVDGNGVSRTLIKAVPLTLAGLGVVIAWRAGMFNIGGEGQFLVGALAGAAIAKLASSISPVALSPLILLGGTIFGGLFAALAGWLQVKRGVQVVISTILLNFLALELMAYAVRGPLQERNGKIFVSDSLPDEVMLLKFWSGYDVHSGVFIALAAVALVWVYLYRTKAGLDLRVVGNSPTAARANKIDVGRSKIWAMFWSGSLCGLAGAIDYSGVTGRIGDGFSQNWGFLAIPVALLGGLAPVGTAIGALFFGALFAGSDLLQRFTPITSAFVPLVQGISVFAFILVNAWVTRRRKLGAVEQ